MQFPVPQFTEVEDKIIGSLTIKQFGILFGGGIIVLLAFTLTKSIIVLIFFGILVGLPTLGVAFAKLNGRPMYNMTGFFIKFLTSPRVLVFHKESLSSDAGSNRTEAKTDKVALKQTVSAMDPKARLKEINQILEKNAEEEESLLK